MFAYIFYLILFISSVCGADICYDNNVLRDGGEMSMIGANFEPDIALILAFAILLYMAATICNEPKNYHDDDSDDDSSDSDVEC